MKNNKTGDSSSSQAEQAGQGFMQGFDSDMAQGGDTNALLIIENERIVYASPAYMQMMGYSPGESLNDQPDDIRDNIHPDDRQQLNEMISKAIASQTRELHYRFREKTRHGKFILREDFARFHYDASGKHIRTYVVCREIDQYAQKKDPSKESPVAGPASILIAEDNRVNMMLTRHLTQQLFPGAEIIEAWNGMQAVEAFRKHLPELILMDIHMPEMDGYQANRTIREIEKEVGGHRPIIAITARLQQGERENCLAAGMDDYLAKPVEEALFKETLSKQMRQHGFKPL